MQLKAVLLTLVTFLLASFSSLSTAASQTYDLDPNHTYLLWHINHLGFSTQAGKWFASGTLVLDQAKPENSKVSATVQINSISTGIPKLDTHIQSADFFDVAKFPTATFVSNKVQMVDHNTAKVYGMLTLHGVTKPLVLTMKLNQTGKNPMNSKMSVGFSGTTSLKRSDFGLNYLVPALGDDVNLNIESEASLAEASVPIVTEFPRV